MTQTAIVPFNPPRLRVTSQDVRRADVDLTRFDEIGLSRTRFEAVLIGCVLNDQTIYPAVARIVSAVDFFNVQHGTIWKVFETLFAERADINLITVTDRLSKIGRKLTDTELVQIASYAADVPLVNSPDYYAQAVREASIKRRMLMYSEELRDILLKDEKPLAVVIDEANAALFKATEQTARARDTTVQAAYSSLFDQVEAAMEGERNTLIPTYLSPLDTMIGGFAPGEITIMAGNAGMGKTAALLTLIYNMAAKGHHVAFFALEMTREDVMSILISMITGINKSVLRGRNLSSKQFGQFVAAARQIDGWNLRILDKHDVPDMTPSRMRTELRYMTDAENFPLEIAVSDGLWLMKPDVKQSEDRHDFRVIMEETDKIALEFSIPVILSHQYSRAINGRSNKQRRPMLSDLAESAAVERNAQLVIGLHRPGYYTGVHQPNEATEWHILKFRNGDGHVQGDYAETYYDPQYSMHKSSVGGIVGRNSDD